FALDPVLDEKEWNQLQTIMDEAGELPKRTPHQKLVNTKIAEKVTKNY
ncbi:ABC transporter substrate-binding protein, partial [Bacillus sp. LR--39]